MRLLKVINLHHIRGDPEPQLFSHIAFSCRLEMCQTKLNSEDHLISIAPIDK